MLKYLAAASLLTLAWAAPAAAQSAPDDRPYSGLYVGVSGGYDVQSNDIGSRLQFDRNADGSYNDTVATATGGDAFAPGFCNGRAQGATPTSNGGCENDRNRGSYYGKVGYDVQFGRIVVGAVGEFGKTNIVDYTSGFSTTPASYTFARRVGWEGSARARAGVALDTTLFYATGGAGYADIKHRFYTTNTANAFADNGNDKQLGFIVGGGVEQQLTRHISFGVEGTYHDYKDNDYRVLATQGTAPATNPFVLAPNTAGTSIRRSDVDFRWFSLRGAVNFRF